MEGATDVHPFDNQDLVALHEAFEKACAQLGISSDDQSRRETLAKLIIGLAQKGERDPNVIERRALMMMSAKLNSSKAA
jgi:hypothetical protein